MSWLRVLHWVTILLITLARLPTNQVWCNLHALHAWDMRMRLRRELIMSNVSTLIQIRDYIAQLASGHGTSLVVKSDITGFRAIGWWVWGIFPTKERNKNKMGCGNREEREGQENLRFFIAILGNKRQNKNLTRLPVPGNIVNILYSQYHDPFHRPVQLQTNYPISVVTSILRVTDSYVITNLRVC